MRSRAAILPTPGDPFQLKLWFFLFEKYWQNEVDKLYVCFNSKIEKEVVDFVKDFMTKNPKVEWLYFDRMIDHGEALKRLLNICTEEYVMLIEDDCMVYKSGAIDEQFKKLEEGKVNIVASPRQSSSYNIAEAAKIKFGSYNHEVFFWPNMFFIKKQELLDTDQQFGRADNFQQGAYIKELNWTVDGPVGADTFVWTSIQLRHKGLMIDWIDQYHAMAEDLVFFREKQRAWKGEAAWSHLGSLSSMMTNFLFDSTGLPLESRRHPNHPPPIDPTNITQPQSLQEEGPKQDMESRVANVLLAWEQTQSQCDPIAAFRKEYIEAIHRLIKSFGLRDNLIKRKMEAYKILYTLHI